MLSLPAEPRTLLSCYIVSRLPPWHQLGTARVARVCAEHCSKWLKASQKWLVS